jgi:hypothetical protein
MPYRLTPGPDLPEGPRWAWGAAPGGGAGEAAGGMRGPPEQSRPLTSPASRAWLRAKLARQARREPELCLSAFVY